MFREIQTLEEIYGEYHASFDWWQSSVDVSGLSYWHKGKQMEVSGLDTLLDLIGDALPMSQWSYHRGSNGYDSRYVLSRGQTQLCTVSAGGCHGLPNVSASGSSSAVVRSVVTGVIPAGKSSRVDSAFDSLSGTEEFKRVTAWAEERARQAGINCRWIINSDQSMGNTLYIGGKSSRVMIRIYEKGKQTGHRPGEWWRAEVQLRPDSKSKDAVYKWSAGMVWSVSRVTRDLWAFLGGEKLQASGFQAQSVEKDLRDRLLHLGIQYGNLLSEALSVYGSPDALVGTMDEILSSAGKLPISGRFPDVPYCPF